MPCGGGSDAGRGRPATTRPASQRQEPDQQRPAAGRRVEHDGGAVAGDQVGLDLLIGPALGDAGRTVARTVTAVWALESATDRSSQLGHRIPDSMASARWAPVGGADEKTPLPTTRATTSTTPSTVHSGKRRRGHACSGAWPWRDDLVEVGGRHRRRR